MAESRFDPGTDDKGLQRSRRQALKRLADGCGGPELTELAREMLAGRLTAWQAATSNTYSEALIGRLGGFASYYETLSQEERDSLAEAGRARLDELADEPDEPDDPDELNETDEPAGGVARPKPALEEDADGTPQTYLEDGWA